ncbi:hypothetical protein COV19_06080 [Candidatus Woesearchaeota archaeon CG10_big_fil_rev_8_21_14_0_10_44_13]|nr:MAG: hypothetical protein COV19_06080 [Candidatus Woesearchaeota archaeon CG10_big_fil_rev_8_21_14_0_10_44_13]
MAYPIISEILNYMKNVFLNVISLPKHLYLLKNMKNPGIIFLFLAIGIGLWYLIRRDFIKFRTKEEKDAYIKERKWIRIYVVISRVLMLLLIGVAFASPFIMKDEVVQGDLSISILADNSTSFDLFDKGIAPKLKDDLDLTFPATLKYIAQGTKSDISGGILNSLKGNDNILLITDGQNNFGKNLRDMILFAANINSTISALDLEPIHPDTSIVVRGVDKAIRGTETTFVVKVTQAGEPKPYKVKVRIGQDEVLSEEAEGPNTFRFSKKMGEGYHKITAELDIKPEDDSFPENNAFYKTVEILARPPLYMMAEKESYFYSIMMDLYNFKREKEFPSDLEPYVAMIMDDISAEKITRENYEALSNFVMNGSGLVVIGGQTSYNTGGYRNSLLETILPVKTMESEKEGIKDESVNVVILVDISDSTGGRFSATSGDKKVDVEKALTVNILKYIKGESKVGIIVFNTNSYEVSPLEPLNQKSGLEDQIMRLVDGGGTDISEGLKGAISMLNKVKGSNNIILISDGVTNSPEAAFAMTERARRLGITVFAVGVGSDTSEGTMKSIASIGGGSFYMPKNAEKLKIIFGEPEEDAECNDEKKRVRILDENHFITEGLEMDAILTGYNYVAPKSSSNPVIVTCDGKPIITVWRYGLGRVVSMATDDGTKWAGEMLSAKNSEIITRMINWAIGDPKRKDEFYVEAADTTLGKPIIVKVKSKEAPSSDLINFTKVDDNKYQGEFNPKEAGFYDIFGTEVAVSYNDELQNVGMNPELYDLVRATGGDVFMPDDIKGIINKTKSVSKRVETSEQFIRWPFILMAMLLLLIEIAVRRIWETTKE